MDEKFKYIRKQLSKANRKSLELYITTRLWHKLDRLDVEFITQQAVKGISNKGYYFVDIYLPQIKMCIEIDEAYHKNIDQQQSDKLREVDIISVTNHKILRIDATKSICKIHKEIDDIVLKINDEISLLGADFKPWTNIYKDSKFYINQGYIDAKENVVFKKIIDACNCLGYSYKGMQKGGIAHPILKDHFIWFPKLYPNNEWENKISDDDNIIYERPIKSQEKIDKHIKDTIEDIRSKRLVFARVKDNLGVIGYRFKGVYQVDIEESLKSNYAVYRKISDIAKTYPNDSNLFE